MHFLKRLYPFNAEQTVNILSEFGPLVTMFIVNGIFGKSDPHLVYGTISLIVTTIIAMVAMRAVLGRFPVFPIIASGVTVVFGLLTLATGDPMWVQIKVSIFNAMFGGFLFGGLWWTSPSMTRRCMVTVVGLLIAGLIAQIPYFGLGWPKIGDPNNPVAANLICLGSLLIGFLLGGLVYRANFFGHVFEKTFHYTPEGWDRFTYSFAWFFVFTAVLNEVVRQVFVADEDYNIPFLGEMNGVNVWILFKIALIMPLSGAYAYYLTRLMQKYRIDPPADGAQSAAIAPGHGFQPASKPAAGPQH